MTQGRDIAPESPGSDPDLISVVIPHMNQPRLLERCLASLAGQAPARRRIEVIVCDNGSDRLPEDVVSGFPGTRLLLERTPGPGPARNAGVSASRGTILAFIDADCTAAPGWLKAIEAAFETPETHIIGGDVRVPFVDQDRPTVLEAYEAVFAYRNAEYIASGYSGTGNLAMRRPVFDAVGPFAGIGVAEDQDWGHRARGAGYVTLYVPEMVIHHPARTSFQDLTRKWDRHISHDFAHRRGVGGRAVFAAKAVALLASPGVEVFRIARSNRIGSWSARALCMVGLTRIRIWRAGRMAGMLMGRGRDSARTWNRGN